MGRGKSLTEYERGQIDVLYAQKIKQKVIASTINRSESLVCRYLNSPETYGTKKQTGRPPKMDRRLSSRVIRLASTGKFFARELVKVLKLPIKARQVRQILAKSEFMHWAKRYSVPALTKLHKERRKKFAEKYQLWEEQWDDVIFSDESKFNLDGPDGYQKYWHDKRKPREQYKKRQNGGGSVMVWGAFSRNGKSELIFLNGNQKAEDYIYTLSEHLLPFAHLHHGTDFIFQQDNASIHTANVTKTWFHESNIEVLEWPAKSPDLNPIENLWAILARDIYDHGRQFNSVQELKQQIQISWDNISISLLQSLSESMPDRLLACMQKKGDKTKY